MVYASELLSGWGNCPVERCDVARPESAVELRRLVMSDDGRSCISRGLGRAYGDSSLNLAGRVIDQTRLNRFTAFDPETGILTCEAGASLAEIMEVFLPRGWFVRTTPGTKFVTVGGAVASDVHGKNHHRDGSFGESVRSFRLLTARGETLDCSRTENADAFRATLGGMGLTGCITEATVQLERKSTAYCSVNYRRTADIEETLRYFEDTDAASQYSVAWIDCVAQGKSLGRSVVMTAHDAAPSDLPAALAANPLRLPIRRKRSVPRFVPSAVLNYQTVRIFNALYYARHVDGRKIVDYDSFFYPLDGLQHWNRIYGRRGFVQYQAFFPRETSRRGIVALLDLISAAKNASFLAVLKSCGRAGEGVLSFLSPGHTLALDFRYVPGIGPFLQSLDACVLRHGGRLYLAKDSQMSAETFAAMYPRLPEFRELKGRVDPERRFVSSQARRLRIAE